ncbi:MAG TPA: Gfo/Idh/MocA family oxidoreductase [Phycisphaerae bacterium]|nr:Gfo/Idh/MocA family oxidoreductase [Phycisphaerae bacterium]HRY70471.1 Gfo/Idh/MocA family oxidoreductase [Phycisphaerae bacterium]HSA27705.1 Gfo/Idh/MocA family oxidoreductase [Phycisphaerae bacterium]
MARKQTTTLTRRQTLRTAAAVIAAPTLIPTRLLGADAPSGKIHIGMIGVGWMGGENLNAFLEVKECRVVAIADVDQNHLASAVKSVNAKYGDEGCKAYKDFRELIGQNDLQAVCISTPDHWHSIPAIAAAKAKKDIYCEKPLSKTLAEGIAMVQAAQQNHRIWQTGSWQRSGNDFRRAAELVLNGYVGKVRRVEVGLPSGHADFERTGNNRPNSDPPKEVDYDFWVGPSEMVPFNPCRFHKNWRWNYNFGGGQLMDWIGHHCDIAHWGLASTSYGVGPDDEIGPMEVSATAEFPPRDALWNTATKYRVECKYPKGIELTIAGGYDEIRSGAKWIGEEGWVWVDRSGFETSKPEWKKEIEQREKGKDLKVLLKDTHGAHQREFIECVKSRKKTLTPAEVAHRSTTPGHLGYIASVVGRTLKWDVAKQQIVGDPEAWKLLSRPIRAPWHV